jgi:hypothetical protein
VKGSTSYVTAFDAAENSVNNWTAPFTPAYTPFEFGYDAAAPDVAGITLNRGSDGLGAFFSSGTGQRTHCQQIKDCPFLTV